MPEPDRAKSQKPKAKSHGRRAKEKVESVAQHCPELAEGSKSKRVKLNKVISGSCLSGDDLF
jgi:hypothetical protein